MKKMILTITLLVLGTLIFLIYLTLSHSKDCNQLVIDTYELYSGINIPEVGFVNCYYDKNSNTRISVYDLNSNIDLSKFKLSNITSGTEFLQGILLLNETERPNEENLYLATGERWGRTWTYVVDNKSDRLWAQLNY